MRQPVNGPSNDDPEHTEEQQEWADWAAHAYRKMYMPRSMRIFGFWFFLLFAILLLGAIWVAIH
jgi:hypothetical protein